MDNLPQNNQNNKKIFLSSLAVKIILVMIIFAGSAIIIISGAKFIIEYYKTLDDNKIVKQVKQTEQEINQIKQVGQIEQEKNQIETADLLFEASVTDDWQIYQNEEFGFEFIYPSYWFQEDIGSGGVSVIRFFNINKYSEIKKINDNKTFSIIKKGEVAEVKISAHYIIHEKIELKNSKITDIKLIQYKGTIISGYLNNDQKINILILQDANSIRFEFKMFINNKKDEEIFDRIISTFKFIEKDETADWQTYRNEEFGYNITYPNGWTVATDNNQIARNAKATPFSNPIEIYKIDNDVLYEMEIVVMDNPSALSLKDWIKKSIEKRPCIPCPNNITDLEEEKINGIIVLTADNLFAIDSRVKRFYFAKNEHVYLITIPTVIHHRNLNFLYSEIFNQIISTFKFID